jgi:thiol-disulfide isomerase/thioredoxin
MMRNLSLIVTVAAFLTAGCAGKSSPPGETIRLPDLDAAGLSKAVEKHKGDVVLVDFWASWCGPCMQLLPHTVDLQKRFHDRGLSVITVSFDDPDMRHLAQRALANADGMATENYLSSYGINPQAFSEFHIDGGSLPHLQLYDRNGKLAKTFGDGDKPIVAAEIDRAVESLLGDN